MLQLLPLDCYTQELADTFAQEEGLVLDKV